MRRITISCGFMTPNQKAFLDTIAISEGTANIGNNGYNVLVGSTPSHPLLFTDYSDHPRIYNKGLNSTAAGRYQLLARFFDYYKKFLEITDFSPESQDKIALQQIKECHAIPDIDAGRFHIAIAECSRIWASLPGNSYGQHENTMADLQKVYIKAGGIVSPELTT